MTGRYLDQAQQLLPRGAAWPRVPGGVLARLLGALAETFERVHDDADALPAALHPITTLEYLERWEEVAGLPDNCSGALRGGIAERRSDLLAKLAAVGGQSPAYFVAVARAQGYTIRIREFEPFRVGISACDQPIYGEEWDHAWAVLAPFSTVHHFTCETPVNMPLAWWGNEALECRIRQLKPAHNSVLFFYDQVDSHWLWNDGMPVEWPSGQPLQANE